MFIITIQVRGNVGNHVDGPSLFAQSCKRFRELAGIVRYILPKTRKDKLRLSAYIGVGSYRGSG